MVECKFHQPTNNAIGDTRTPLPAGTVLVTTNGTRYLIKDDSVVAGGSALIYRATREGSFRNFILKECYPFSTNFRFARIDGVVRPLNEDSDAENYLQLVKDSLIRENAVGQIISNQSGRIIAAREYLAVEKLIIDGQTFDAAGSYFVVLEEATDGKNRGCFLQALLDECAEAPQLDAPFRTGGNPAPHVAAAIMEELLKALRDVHKAGYVHGDINDSNFFLMGADFSSGDVGVGQLLDFGNAFKLQADGKTLPIKDVFSTPGYWAPEILDNCGEIRLSPATDVYSAGCLMLYLLKGMRYKRACGRNLAKNFSVAAFVPLKKLMKCGYRRESAILFEKILTKALAYDPNSRYRDAGQMLKDVIFLRKILAPPKFNLSPNLSRSPYFVNGSRDEVIARLQTELENGVHPLWLWGIGGIGKTEVAMEFARKQIADGRSAYVVTFRENMRETVRSMNFSGWEFEFNGSGDAAEAEYQARLDLLRENYADALLIVDNFDSPDASLAELQREPAYADILALNMKILFTTRSRPNNSTPELEPLDEESALKLFRSIAKVSDGEEKTVRKLLREVDCHPMTVEILAHTLNESWGTISANELLARLQAESLNVDALPNVKHTKDNTEREAKIYGHLRTLFRLFNVEDYREVLCHTTLLPTVGFDATEFILSEDFGKKKQLKFLEGRGWLRRRTETNSLWIHPLIRTIFRNELKPTEADCEHFLSTLWTRLDERYPQERHLFQQAADLFERAAAELGDERGQQHFHAGFCCLISGQFARAVRLEEVAVRRREVVDKNTDADLARLYNDFATAVCYTHDYERGMTYFEKAAAVLNSVAPNDPNSANIFANTANAFIFLGHYEKAFDFARRALEIFDRTPPKNRQEHANAYSILGSVLTWLQRFSEARRNFFAAAKILQDLAPEGSVELAKAYMDIGQAFFLEGDNENSLDYLRRAVALMERLLPKNHVDRLSSYELLSHVLQKVGRSEESKKFSELIQKISQETLANELKDLLTVTLDTLELRADKMSADEFVKCHTTAAFCYRKLGELETAKKFIDLAQSRIPDAKNLVEVEAAYSEAAEICEAEKNFKAALTFEQKALAFVFDFEPENFIKLSKHFMRLGKLNDADANFQDALDNMERAILFRLKCPYPNFDFVRDAQKAAGFVLMKMKRFDSAQAVFEKLLEEVKVNLMDDHPTVLEISSALEEVRRRKLNQSNA